MNYIKEKEFVNKSQKSDEFDNKYFENVMDFAEKILI